MNPRPVRVLLLCDSLRLAGGVERFVCAMATHLADEGMDVTVGTVDTAPHEVRYALHPSVRVVNAHAAPGAGASGHETAGSRSCWARAARLFRAQWRIGRSLAQLARTQPADVIVLNGLTTACSTLVFERGHDRRTICCDHNHFNARSRLWRRLRGCLYPQVAAVVSLTEADAPKFRAINPRTHVIYNASALRADAPPLPDMPRVLAVGRHVAQKGFDLLIEAWPKVASELPEARLRIVGDGALRAEAEKLARARGVAGSVEFALPIAQIECEYREAAVFVLPSRYEGMPLALLEAQAMGLPCVAFDCPTGPAEILTSETGILVPLGDTATLAQALLRLLRDRALRERMALAAIERSRRVFSESAHFRRWTTLVREVGARQAQGAQR
jgi:glycosyltransferase involved in cell wall biosynthesis